METEQKGRRIIRTIGRFCGWLALGLLLFTLLTGYGITEYRIVTPLTLGVLNKAVSQHLHSYTEAGLVILLLVHVVIAVRARRNEDKMKAG